LSLEAWRQLIRLPGFTTSLEVSLATGVVTTFVSLGLVVAFCAAWHGTRLFSLLVRLLGPLLSVPHAAVAFGMAFLLSPSGWIVRLLSPRLTGYTEPPDWLIIHDPHGLALTAGLIAKEVPFLFLMTLAAIGQVDAERSRMVAQTLGYQRMNGWLKVVFPRVYRQIRLPVYAVLAYGVSVVDVAIILGPTTPAPLAVRLVKLFNDPDLGLRFPASAGALVQLGLAAMGIIFWLGLEWVVRRLGRRWICAGNRGGPEFFPRFAGAAAFMICPAAVAAGLLSMVLWSFARTWRFPELLPSGLTVVNWVRHLGSLGEPLLNTVVVGLSAALIALGLALGLLEHESRCGHRTVATGGGFLYLPLLIPQVAFLLGGQILLVLVHLDGRWLALTWLHLVFVFPYVLLSLADSYRAWDQRYGRTGLCLGATPFRVFVQLKLPMLLRPVLAAGAVGFAVSVGLYLPTLFAGNGRYPTLTTEAVTLSAGGDNRLIGLYALLQMILPLLGFTFAAAVPWYLFRDRRAMQVTR
jgi:putative thiamine transport system permease protein